MLDSLITASLDRGDLTYLEKLPRLLLNSLEREALDWLRGYTRKYGHPPSIERFQVSDHGIFVTRHLLTSPLADLYDQTVEMKRREYFLAKFHELEVYMSGGEDLPISDVIQLGRDLSAVSVDEDDSILSFDREALYTAPHKSGLTFGYDILDEASGGIQPGEYALLVARTGVGKSLMVCHFALRWARAGKRVLVISCEMPTLQMVARLDAMIGGFNPRYFRTRENPDLLLVKHEQVKEELRAIRERGGDIFFPRSREVSTQRLRGLIADRRPDVVVIDGVYLLRHEEASNVSSDWQRLKASSNEIKQICLEENLPVFATSQLKRTGKDDGYTLEDIAYSDSLGQDTDLVLVANKFAGVANQLTVEIIKNRHGESYGGTVIRVDWDLGTLQEVAWADATETVKIGRRSSEIEEGTEEGREALYTKIGTGITKGTILFKPEGSEWMTSYEGELPKDKDSGSPDMGVPHKLYGVPIAPSSIKKLETDDEDR